MLLSEMAVGSRGRILSFRGGEPEFRRRLLTLGLTPGVRFEIVREAPMGDPLELLVRNSKVSVRRDEARIIETEELSV